MSMLSVLSVNWHTWYLEGANSYSNISLLNEFQNLNPFLDKFRPIKSKLFIFAENWLAKYLEDADTYFGISASQISNLNL